LLLLSRPCGILKKVFLYYPPFIAIVVLSEQIIMPLLAIIPRIL